MPSEYIADGSAHGLRWYIQRFPDLAHPLITVDGFDGPAYIHASASFQDAGPERAARFAEQVLAAARARRGKRR